MNGGINLTVIALATVLSISFVSWLTKDRIAQSNQRWIEKSLVELVPAQLHDEQMIQKRFNFQHPALGIDSPLPVYPIVTGDTWNGAAITAIAPNGYTGQIKLLIAIRSDHSLLGVRVLEHRETPGLGDDIERDKSDWITQFDNASFKKYSAPLWAVKKNGGVFDQFTGATVTPSAVVHAVKQVLTWHQDNGLRLLQQRFDEPQQ